MGSVFQTFFYFCYGTVYVQTPGVGLLPVWLKYVVKKNVIHRVTACRCIFKGIVYPQLKFHPFALLCRRRLWSVLEFPRRKEFQPVEEYCGYTQTTDEKHNMSPDRLYGAIRVSRRCLQSCLSRNGGVNTMFFAKNIHRSLLDRNRVYAARTRSARRRRSERSSAVLNQHLFNHSTSNIFLILMCCSLGNHHKQLSVSVFLFPGAVWRHVVFSLLYFVLTWSIWHRRRALVGILSFCQAPKRLQGFKKMLPDPAMTVTLNFGWTIPFMKISAWLNCINTQWIRL